MDLGDYVARVATRCGGLKSVWLIGSRANDTARDDSDYDLLAFGDCDVLVCLKAADDLHRPDVDFFVVTNGKDFENAWGKTKTGSLSLWEWSVVSDVEAQYTEAKWVETDEEGSVVLKRRAAVRVWPQRAIAP